MYATIKCFELLSYYVFDFVLLVFNVQNPELATDYVMFGFNNTHITIPAGAIRNIKGSNSYIIVV